MKRRINIEGMSCEHCKNRVEKVLNENDHISAAIVDLDQACAIVETNEQISDQDLRTIVEDSGYDVTGIETCE